MKTGIIISLSVLFGCIISTLILVDKFQASKKVWDAANKCTAVLIAQGVERKNIIRLDGECFIK